MTDFTVHRTEFGPFRWYADPRKCSHSNDDACPTCDHDGYYQSHIQDGDQDD